nr:ribonuclease H-like domain-containing protein [Tanacetum cinerariifolium]
MTGSDNESVDASVHNEAINTQQQPNTQPQIITTVSNNNAKFSYLKKDEYKSIPDDHVADFHYMDGARDIWNAVKARFGGNAESKKMRKSMLKQEFLEFRIGEAEGLHKGYDRMQKILSQLNQLKDKPEDEDINLKFLRALPSLWSHVALTLKTKGGLELLSFDDLYYKLKTLEVDVKGYTTFFSSQYARPSHSAFVSTTSASKKMSYGDSLNYSSTTTYSVPSNSKTVSHRSGNVIKDVLQSFVADTELEQQLAYEDFEQIEKLDLEEMDLKWKMAMLSVRVHKFEQKAKRKIDFDKKESARFNKKKVRCYKCQQRGHFARECRATRGNDKKRYSSFKIKKIRKKEEDLKALITVDTLVDWTDHDGESDGVVASKEFGMIVGCDTEDAIEEGAAKIYNLITGADTEEANTAGDAGEFALIGVTSEIHNCPFGCNNNVFTTTSEDVEGRPLFYRFAKFDSMKAVPPPLSGDYTSLSDHSDLDESQMSYVTKSSTSSDSKSVSNDFVSCDDNDKSSEVNTNNFASSDSSVKSSEPKPNDSTSCASTSSFLLVNIPPARPQPVPTGKPKVFVPVPTGRQNRPFPVPTDRGYSPSKNPFPVAEDEGIFDSGCSRGTTGNKERLDDLQAFQGRKVTFGGGEDTECLVLSKDFKLPDESMVVLRVPRKHNLYTINLNNLCPKGKQHKASYKAINVVSSISKPLQLLHMDLFGLTSIRSIDHKYYCLVITDDYSRFCWVFFLERKDETYLILKDFINLVGNQLNKKVKAIRCDNGTEFKNAHVIELCWSKGIKKKYSNARTPQQNEVARRKNKTLIEAVRTMLADSKLPTMF